MKKLIIACCLTILTGCAGMEPVKDATIENIVEVPGHTKDQIYIATKIWIAENFVSSKAVIELDDKAEGKIIGNAIIQYPCSGGLDCMGKGDWKLHFTMRVDIKDQKFKTTFTNLALSFPRSIYVPGLERPLHRKGEIEEVKPSFDKIGEHIRVAIEKEKTAKDW